MFVSNSLPRVYQIRSSNVDDSVVCHSYGVCEVVTDQLLIQSPGGL